MNNSASAIKESEPRCGCVPFGADAGVCGEALRLFQAVAASNQRRIEAEKQWRESRKQWIAAVDECVAADEAYRAHVEASNG